MRVMAIDYGTKAIGLAICDELQLTVRPLTTIRREKQNQKQAVERIIAESPRSIAAINALLARTESLEARLHEIEEGLKARLSPYWITVQAVSITNITFSPDFSHAIEQKQVEEQNVQKEEFVRQQTAYALGQTRSYSAVSALIERLTDKKDSVRGAAAVALEHQATVIPAPAPAHDKDLPSASR